MKPRYCEDHQDYKYINFCPFCKVIADRDRLAKDNQVMREALKEIAEYEGEFKTIDGYRFRIGATSAREALKKLGEA